MIRLQPTIRLRLTAWYAAIFMVCGAVLLGASYFVVREEFQPEVERRAVVGEGTVTLPADESTPPDPAGREVPAPQGGTRIAPSEQPAQIEQRVRAEEQRRDEEALRDVLGWFAALLGLMTVGSVAIGWLVAGRALAPVSRITDTARRVSGRSLHERIALAGPRDELKELADTFDAMLARLDATFESHRRFVANASHELRTPLAIIRAELEELVDTGPVRPDQAAMLANARKAASRSERLIASLLTLARSEGEAARQTPVDLADIVQQALMAERCVAERVRISTDLRPARVAGDPVLLESLVVNLIENGLRYNHAGGELNVATRVDGEVELVVANTGPPVDPDVVGSLFDPFARADQSRTSGDAGFGLGLSIVRAVAAAHAGTVAVVPRPGGGLIVTIRLPVAADAAGERRAASVT